MKELVHVGVKRLHLRRMKLLIQWQMSVAQLSKQQGSMRQGEWSKGTLLFRGRRGCIVGVPVCCLLTVFSVVMG